MSLDEAPRKSGFVALLGRPNVGKSTLINGFLGERLNIVTPKPQTTRHRIAGIYTDDECQIVFLDTPGVHKGESKALNRYMNRVATNTLAEADVVLVLIQALKLTQEDRHVLKLAANTGAPTILAINKVDLVDDKTRLLPFLQQVAELGSFDAVMLISALKESGCDALKDAVVKLLPEQGLLYAPDQLTDKSEKFLAAEMVREQLTLLLDQELPYRITVEIEQFQRDESRLNINALIWVERDSHKGIVVGKGGSMLKNVGIRARKQMQTFFQCPVHLELWVKVREHWSDDERQLRAFGYDDA